MLIVTINEVPGKKIEALGVVRGSTVQSRNLGHDIMAGFRTLVGGEVTDYAEMLTEPGRLPQAAWQRMQRNWEPMLWLGCATPPPVSCRAQQRSLLTERR